MSNESKCPQCGVPLPQNAPAGLCPNCLMALNLKTETVFSGDAPAAQSPLPPEEIAPHFPQLEILECLGRGGMGVVYKARQKTLNRLVALKLLAPERVHDSKFAGRFAREAQALAALNHPNIVTIHDFGQAGGFYYLLMEFVDGVNLRQLLRTRKFTPEEALAIVPPLCDALQFAHERGIVHRDIKPENLLLDKSGRVKIADFGIAKILGTDDAGSGGNITSQDNATKTALGTPGYSAPEQKTSPERVDSRADIYSLGVVFYEMLTGELPAKRIEPPSKKVQIDVRLDAVVMRALEKTPELRWQTAAELRTQVETIAQTEKTSPSPAPSGMKPQFSRKAILGAIWLPLLIFFASRSLGIPHVLHRLATGRLNLDENTNPILLFLAAIGAIGTTGLGWQAIGDIRRSRGQIIGLPLAMADALLVPLILVDALIIFLCCVTAIAVQGSPDLSNRSRALVVIFSVFLCLIADIMAVLSVWRYATKPLTTTGEKPVEPPLPPAGKQPSGGQPSEVQSRFSRTAIVGACWAPVFFFALVLMNWVALPIAVPAGQTLPVKGGFVLALVLPLAALGLTAPFGTTILGWIAVAQIRRSAGKLYGLGLAVFDGLLFPLLALDALIFFVCLRAMEFHFHSHEFNQHPQFILFWILSLSVIAVVDVFIVRAVWRKVLPPEQAAQPSYAPRVAVGAIIASVLILVVVLGLLFQTSTPNGNDTDLANSPFKLRMLPTEELIPIGISQPMLPWAWQEMEQRSRSGQLSAEEATKIVDGLTAWIRRDYPNGYEDPLHWLGSLLEELNRRQIVPETNVLNFVMSLHGNPSLEPLPRLRENEKRLELTCILRSPWNDPLLGLRFLNQVRTITVDGQPVAARDSYGRQWNQQRYSADLQLPALAVGKHTIKCDVDSALIRETDIAGLDPQTPPKDWPPAAHSWVRSCQAEFVVYKRDEELVTLSEDPGLDPVANKAISIKQVIIRPKNGHLTAVVLMNGEPKLGLPVSVAVTLHLAGKPIPCGTFWAEKCTNRETSSSGNELTADFDSLDPELKDAEILLTPAPKAVESRAGITRIWGRPIVLSHVPLTRQDRAQNTNSFSVEQ